MTLEYQIKQLEHDEVNKFLYLHDQVLSGWGEMPNRQFKWKYIDNPFADHIPVFVAKRDGEVVGGRGYMALEVKVAGDKILALQSGDLMVHPDHRRNGIFTALNDVCLSHYKDSEYDLFFSFPAENPRAGYLKTGWQKVTLSGYVRPNWNLLEAPRNIFRLEDYYRRVLEAKYLAKSRLNTFRLKRSQDDGFIERFETPLIETLTELYQSRNLQRAHVERSAEFYTWRFSEPLNKFSMYVGYSAKGESKLAIIVGERRGSNVVTIRDIVPPLPVHNDGLLHQVVNRIVKDFRSKEIRVWGDTIPGRILSEYGFLQRAEVPFLRPPNPIIAMTTNQDQDMIVNGVDLSSSESWYLSLMDRDW